MLCAGCFGTEVANVDFDYIVTEVNNDATLRWNMTNVHLGTIFSIFYDSGESDFASEFIIKDEENRILVIKPGLQLPFYGRISGRFTVNVNGNGEISLSLKNVKYEDSGLFTIRCKYRGEETSTNVTLDVQGLQLYLFLLLNLLLSLRSPSLLWVLEYGELFPSKA